MAQAAQVRSVILSTQKTEKITRAMQLVAASKLQKTQNRMTLTRPYAEKMLQVIRHVAGANSECRHPYLVAREATHHTYIVVTTDRGLCGGLNANLFKTLLSEIKANDARGVTSLWRFLAIKGHSFLNASTLMSRRPCAFRGSAIG